MNAYYAEICRVGKFEAYLQQASPVQIFLKFNSDILKHQ